MKHLNLWLGIVLIMMAAIGLAACSPQSTYVKEEPVELVDQGDGRNLVILTERAAERLDIQTAMVGEEQIVVKRKVGGEVAEANPGSGALVMVSLSSDEAKMVNTGVPAIVFPLTEDDPEDEDEAGLSAEFDEQPGLDDAEDSGEAHLYYTVADANNGLAAGQRLKVEVSMLGEQGPRLVVPESSLIYDLSGGTWVYISPENLQFLRFPVVVDYILDDKVILLEGPPVGSKVVTVGVAELHGADTGVGK